MRRSIPALLVAPAALALATLVAVLGAAPARALERPAGAQSQATAAAALPGLARDLLPLVTDLTGQDCPDLPPAWVVAQVQAASGWDPALRADRPGGTAGLYQLDQQDWLAAGGQAWASDPPAAGSGVLDAAEHLRVAIPWMCSTLRGVTGHLRATGKPTTPLDALSVCHVAGCGGVTGSRTGVPDAGEAGCEQRCAQLVHRFIVAVHDDMDRFSGPGMPARSGTAHPAAAAPRPGLHDGPDIATGAQPRTGQPARPSDAGPMGGTPPGPTGSNAAGTAGGTPVRRTGSNGSGTAGGTAGGAGSATGLAAPAPWTGGSTGCNLPDPTSRGCLTGATRHGLEAVAAAFGGYRGGPAVHGAGCWSPRPASEHSDHAVGKACDLMMTTLGTFAGGADLANGWKVASWLRANAAALHVEYLIWQGRFWQVGTADAPGAWGVPYTGGGLYDVRTPTGGHFDHVHVSFAE